MEIIPGMAIGVNMIVGFMVKVSMVLFLILSLVMVRQGSLMDRVVNLPIGKGIKVVIWGYFILSFVLTVVVLLA